MLPVGLCDCKLDVHPLLTIMFKNILRTFEAEILKLFKTIQPRPKNYIRSYKKKECMYIILGFRIVNRA